MIWGSVKIKVDLALFLRLKKKKQNIDCCDFPLLFYFINKNMIHLLYKLLCIFPFPLVSEA